MMSGTEIALVLTALGTLVSALAASTAVVIGAINSRQSIQNGRKIDAVHNLTNGMAVRGEENARELGQAKGYLQGRLDHEQEGKAEKIEQVTEKVADQVAVKVAEKVADKVLEKVANGVEGRQA